MCNTCKPKHCMQCVNCISNLSKQYNYMTTVTNELSCQHSRCPQLNLQSVLCIAWATCRLILVHVHCAGCTAVAAVYLTTVWGELAYPPRPAVGLQRCKLCVLRRLQWQPVHRLPLLYASQHCGAEDPGTFSSAGACSSCYGAHSGHLVSLFYTQ